MLVDNLDNVLGADSANNQFASTNVVANADGSVLERLEAIQQAVGGVDSTSNPIGANDADNLFDSSAVVANVDGSVLERLEDIVQKVTVVDGLMDVPSPDLATDATINQVVGKKADTVNGTSIVSLIKQVIAKLVKPVANVADDVTIADVIGIKADTVAGTSIVAMIKQALAVMLFPTTNLATDLTFAQVIGQKADTVAGTSIVSLIRQMIATKSQDDWKTAKKSYTFVNNSTGVLPLFTVTGGVAVKILAVCSTGLTSDDVGTLQLNSGVTELIAASTATDFLAGEIWCDNTPTTKVQALSTSILEFIIGDGGDLSLTVANTVDSGVLEFMIEWKAITSDGAVVAV